jgi:hypothetical protein
VGRVSWVQRVQLYVDGWATAPQNVIMEDRPHDDTAWEAYIQWYTPRTRSRVMYVPPQPTVVVGGVHPMVHPENSVACDVRPTATNSASSGRGKGARF